jgi:hypothetical protein
MGNSWHVWQKRVRVGETPMGKGIFALRSFRRSQVIGIIQGIVCTDPEYGSAYCMDIGENRSLEPIAPFRYLNHCCDPNAELVGIAHLRHGPTGQLLLEAARDIPCGEEITIDYAWQAEHAIPCQCGSAKCRGWIVSAEEWLRQGAEFSIANASAVVAQPVAAAEMN